MKELKIGPETTGHNWKPLSGELQELSDNIRLVQQLLNPMMECLDMSPQELQNTGRQLMDSASAYVEIRRKHFGKSTDLDKMMGQVSDLAEKAFGYRRWLFAVDLFDEVYIRFGTPSMFRVHAQHQVVLTWPVTIALEHINDDGVALFGKENWGEYVNAPIPEHVWYEEYERNMA